MTPYRYIALACLSAIIFGCSSPQTNPALPDPTGEIDSQAMGPDSSGTGNIGQPGDYPEKIRSGGSLRTYLLHVPEGYDGSRPLPIVLVFHGFGGNAAGMAKLTGWNDRADAHIFFVAYLNGTMASGSDAGVEGAGWNNGITPDLGLTTDDVGFVRDVVGQLKQRFSVDGQRVYAAGFSNGAFMTHRLGAELPDLLAGIAAVEGTIGNALPDGELLTVTHPMGPMPVIIVHGEADTHVLYDGGQATEGLGKMNAMSVEDAVKFWVAADGCRGLPREANNSANVLVTDYRECSSGSEVLLYTVVNGRHEWPTLAGHTGFSATDAIWDFFSQHRHP